MKQKLESKYHSHWPLPPNSLHSCVMQKNASQRINKVTFFHFNGFKFFLIFSFRYSKHGQHNMEIFVHLEIVK